MTGDTLSPVAKAFLEDSQAPYLVKPFHAEEVRRVVQHALHRLEVVIGASVQGALKLRAAGLIPGGVPGHTG